MFFNDRFIQCKVKTPKKREGSRSFCGSGFFLSFPQGHVDKWTKGEKYHFKECLKKNGFTFKVNRGEIKFYCPKHKGAV